MNNNLLKRSLSKESLQQINHINELNLLLDDDLKFYYLRFKNNQQLLASTNIHVQNLNESISDINSLQHHNENEILKKKPDIKKLIVNVEKETINSGLTESLKEYEKIKHKDETLIEGEQPIIKKRKFNNDNEIEENKINLNRPSSFNILVNFFQAIQNQPILYETSSERQLLKYKLRKMEALYSLDDSERLSLKEMFFDKLPELVLVVLLESSSFLLNKTFFKDLVETQEKSKVVLLNEQLVPQFKNVII